MPTDPRTGNPLLDTVIDRFAADQAQRDADQPVAPVSPDQLALFDVSEDGVTPVAYDGQTL